jgi:hypothetical protein
LWRAGSLSMVVKLMAFPVAEGEADA